MPHRPINTSELINDIATATGLTQSAIDSANSDDWETAQSLIKQREKVLQILPENYSAYTEQQQLQLRDELTQLNKLNAEFMIYADHSRQDTMQKKSTLKRNKVAINNYLDNS